MASLEVRPLVVVREHRAGFFSVFPAFDPALVSYAGDRDKALDELRLYLSELFGRLSADEIQKFVLPERAELRTVSVVVPHGDLPRAERVKTPISMTVIELSAKGGYWLLIPVLGHVTFLPEEARDELEARVESEVLRVAAARDLRGMDYIDLLPTEALELERLAVELALLPQTFPSPKFRERDVAWATKPRKSPRRIGWRNTSTASAFT